MHNKAFDLGVLLKAFETVNVYLPLKGTPDCWDTLCTQELAKQLDLPEKLDELCEILGIKHGQAHDALADASATLQVWQQLKSTPKDAVKSSIILSNEISKRQKLESALETANAVKKRMEGQLVEALQQKEKQQDSAQAMLKKLLAAALNEKGYTYK